MGYNFNLNPVLPIGSTIGHPLCVKTQFNHHEVAWAGDCTENDVVCDACLQLNGAPDPATNPIQPLLAVNMIFGAAGSGYYRDKIATHDFLGHCEPKPVGNRRRRLLTGPLATEPTVTTDLADLMRRFDFEHWPRPGPDDAKWFFWSLVLGPYLLSNFKPARTQEEPMPQDCRFTASVWLPPDGVGLVRLDTYECASRQAAELCLLDLLNSSQTMENHRDPRVNFPLFSCEPGPTGCRYWARGNLAFFVANAERKRVPLDTVVADLNRLFSVDPPGPRPDRVPVPRFTPPPAVHGQAVPLKVEADYPLPCWFRIGTRLGEVRREGQHLLYEAASPGTETMSLLVTGSDGRVGYREFPFAVS
jgi:hypothetical protein